MSAKMNIGGNSYDIVSGITIADAAHSLGFSPDTFIFTINGNPVPMDTFVDQGDIISSIKVASGG